jgi:hypothetical protein
MTEETEVPAVPDWTDIRARYEAGVEKVAQIAAAIGLAGVTLSNRAKAEGWTLRRVRIAAPKSDEAAHCKPAQATTSKPGKAQSTRQTLLRLKDIIQTRLRHVEGELGEIGEKLNSLSSEREIRSTNTLVRTLEKVLEIEHKERKQRGKLRKDKLRLDDAGRDELARRIASLCESGPGENTEPQTGDGPSAGPAVGLAPVGEA